MRRLDLTLAWLIMLVGLRLALTSHRAFAEGSRPWPVAFYLVASAFLFGLCGSINLVRMRYAAVAPGLRALAAVTSVLLAALTLVANTIGGELGPALVIAALLLASAVFSVRPAPAPEQRG